MLVPLTVRDFIDRAAGVYGLRTGVVDEPNQPADTLGAVSYAHLRDLAERQAARLDELGMAVGDRVAIVSYNSARLLTSFFGVVGSGRVLVPINFRLTPEEIRYILDHSGARMLLVDPELDGALSAVSTEFRIVLGDDEALFAREGAIALPWAADENATACINYTSGTTARPKGVQLTHRNLWIDAITLGLHAGLTDRDVYLHTLPMFHVNGWGMPYIAAGLGIPQIVLRRIDGEEILRRIESHGVTLLCAAPAVMASILEAASSWEGEVPGRGRVRVIVAGAPPHTRIVARIEDELGWEFMQLYGLTETAPLLTFNRSRQEWDDFSPLDRAHALTRAGVPTIGTTLAIGPDGEVLARSNTVLAGYWEQPEASTDALAGDGFIPATGESSGKTATSL